LQELIAKLLRLAHRLQRTSKTPYAHEIVPQ
jgi:hypothetical protein